MARRVDVHPDRRAIVGRHRELLVDLGTIAERARTRASSPSALAARPVWLPTLELTRVSRGLTPGSAPGESARRSRHAAQRRRLGPAEGVYVSTYDRYRTGCLIAVVAIASSFGRHRDAPERELGREADRDYAQDRDRDDDGPVADADY